MGQKFIEFRRHGVPILVNKKRIIYIQPNDAESTYLYLNDGRLLHIEGTYEENKQKLMGENGQGTLKPIMKARDGRNYVVIG